MKNKDVCFSEEIKLGENTYTYVWGDDFDGETLDPSKWTWDCENSGMKSSDITELINVDDERAIRLKNGNVQLIASVLEEKEDGKKLYGTPASLSTHGKMAYTYGYCEIRARVPFGKGLWPGFWATTDCSFIDRDKMNYVAEIDIFEIFGTLDGVVPNIHKWYKKSNYPYDEIHGEKTNNHTQFNGYKFFYDKNENYYFAEHQDDISNLNNEFHIYGFEWTPKEMSMYVDGEKYMTYDIVNSYDSSKEMDDFHQPTSILFNNHLFVSSGDFIPEFERGVPTLINGNEEVLPSIFEIDYFRLYQNKSLTSNKLFVKDKS